MLFARTCAVCGQAGAAMCGACLADLRPAPALPPPPGVHDCRALLSYEGAARRLVSRLKYRNNRAALAGLAEAAASLVTPGEVDVVTWAPTTAARRRHRGYDQSELLARGVARGLGRPCVGLLRRVPGPAQTGRSAAERWGSPGFTLRRVANGRILVVDDVVTTGATVAAAAACLRAGGMLAPVVLVLARTPLKATTQRDEEESVKPHPPSLDDDQWRSLCAAAPVRPARVAAGRARVTGDDWPEALAVADAVLAWPRRLLGFA